MIVRFVDIGGIVDHHCLKVIVRFVDIGEIVDHLCLNFFFHNIHHHLQSRRYIFENFIFITIK